MKITHVRVLKMSGTLHHEGEFWEERLIRPVDIYPEHRAEVQRIDKADSQSSRITAYFVRIETDQASTASAAPFRKIKPTSSANN